MAKKKGLPKWATTVTPFSKMLALSMLIVIPVLAFFYGMYYQKQIDSISTNTDETIIFRNSNPGPYWKPADGTVTCNTTVDCPDNYTCAQAGPIRADGHNHKTCWKKGDAMPL